MFCHPATGKDRGELGPPGVHPRGAGLRATGDLGRGGDEVGAARVWSVQKKNPPPPREGRVAARISGAADPSVLRAMIDAVVAE